MIHYRYFLKNGTTWTWWNIFIIKNLNHGHNLIAGRIFYNGFIAPSHLHSHFCAFKILTCASRSIVEKIYATIHTLLWAYTFSFWVLQWKRVWFYHHFLYLITCSSWICSSITYCCIANNQLFQYAFIRDPLINMHIDNNNKPYWNWLLKLLLFFFLIILMQTEQELSNLCCWLWILYIVISESA